MSYKEQIGLVSAQLGFKVDGGGAPIIAGFKERYRVPSNCILRGWIIMEVSETPISGSIVIDVKKGTYSDYDATPVFTSIAGSEKPTISSAFKADLQNLTDWDVELSAGDFLEYMVDSASDVESIQLYLIIDIKV